MHHHLVGTAGRHKQTLQRVGGAWSWDSHPAEHRSAVGREREREEGKGGRRVNNDYVLDAHQRISTTK